MTSAFEFAAALKCYCLITEASVTSWGRTAKHNAAVGGVTYSAHRAWMAADVVYDQVGPVDVRERLADNLGLRLIHEGDHDHVQPASWLGLSVTARP